MAIKQLSVFVENKSGKLLETVKVLADAKIDIRAMSIADTKDFGILRLIVSDIEGAKNVLEDSIFTVTDVVAAEMKDESGALYDIMSVLGNANINIDYMYAFTSTVNSGAYVVLRVDDNDATEEILESNGIKVLVSADI